MSTTITLEQYVKACRAFWRELDIELDANEVYFPVHLDEHQVTFPRVPRQAGVDDIRNIRAESLGFTGDLSDVLSIVTKIKVVD